MKLLIPISGTLVAVGCAVWAYLSYTSRKQVVLYQTSRAGSESEPA